MRYHSAIFPFVGNTQIRVQSFVELPKMEWQSGFTVVLRCALVPIEPRVC